MATGWATATIDFLAAAFRLIIGTLVGGFVGVYLGYRLQRKLAHEEREHQRDLRKATEMAEAERRERRLGHLRTTIADSLLFNLKALALEAAGIRKQQVPVFSNISLAIWAATRPLYARLENDQEILSDIYDFYDVLEKLISLNRYRATLDLNVRTSPAGLLMQGSEIRESTYTTADIALELIRQGKAKGGDALQQIGTADHLAQTRAIDWPDLENIDRRTFFKKLFDKVKAND